MTQHAVLFASLRTIVRLYTDPAERRALADDPLVRRFSHWPDATDEAFATSIAAMAGRTPFDGGGWMNFAVDLADGRYAGDHALLVEGSTAKLGLALLPAMRGQGLAQDVLGGSLALLRRHGVLRAQAEIDPANDASLAAFERAGFGRVRLAADDLGPFWLLERGL